MNLPIVLQANVHDGAVTRRAFLRRLAGSTAAGGLFGWERMIVSADELRRQGRACILLWMQGGPSQLETFDPKPGADNGGPTLSIETRFPGLHIAEHWPRVAQIADHLAIVRSVTNREGNHQRATYQLHTGYLPGGGVKHPHLGSVAAGLRNESAGDLPAFVSVGVTQGAGFLGVRHDPFVVNDAGQMPANTRLAVRQQRFSRRLGLLKALEGEVAAIQPALPVADHRDLYDRAAQLVLSPRLGSFDLSQEPQAVRDAYGSSDFGQSCLLARRLVEAGVTFVEVRSNGWDTHQDNFDQHARLAGEVDPAFAQLIADLKQRGLLESTLVVWIGEFGRTPLINPRSGRDHFPRAFNVALAGAGIRGGQVIGATSDDGMEITSRPVSVPDLFCSFCRCLGLDPRQETLTPVGRPLKIVDGGEVVKELFG